MVFWKPFAVQGCAGFSQPYNEAEVPVTGVTVYSCKTLLINQGGTYVLAAETGDSCSKGCHSALAT